MCPLKFSSPYNGSKVTGVVGSTVNFTWAFSGGKIDLIQWGTKQTDSLSFQDILVSIDRFSTVTTIQTSPYDGRVSGVWDGSSPGQATFTLKPTQKADKSFYICMLHPRRTGALPIYDTVHLQVIGKYTVVAYSLPFLLLFFYPLTSSLISPGKDQNFYTVTYSLFTLKTPPGLNVAQEMKIFLSAPSLSKKANNNNNNNSNNNNNNNSNVNSSSNTNNNNALTRER